MAVSALLRFGLVGTLILAVVPLFFIIRYLLSHHLVKYTVETRPLDASEHTRLDALVEKAELPDAEVIVATDVETQIAALSGTPWNRRLLLSETTLETTTDEELTGLIGLAAGKHEVWLPELYAGYLVVASTAFVTFLGVDPSGLGSALIAVFVVVGLLGIVGLDIQILRLRVYAADQAAVRRVGRRPVEAAIRIVPTRRLPGWLPTIAKPKPSCDNRLNEL